MIHFNSNRHLLPRSVIGRFVNSGGIICPPPPIGKWLHNCDTKNLGGPWTHHTPTIPTALSCWGCTILHYVSLKVMRIDLQHHVLFNVNCSKKSKMRQTYLWSRNFFITSNVWLASLKVSPGCCGLYYVSWNVWQFYRPGTTLVI